MKKLAVIALVLSITGCATLARFCPDRAEADKLRADIGTLLKISQQGYEQVMTLAGKSGDPRVALAAKALDGALAALGGYYFDRACPTHQELEQAAYEAEMAAKAKEVILIGNEQRPGP